MHTTAAPVRVAVLGAGTVGTEVLRILIQHSEELRFRIGAPVEVVAVGVSDAAKPRADWIDPALFTSDLRAAVAGADIVVELMGGIRPAKDVLLAAIRSGAAVVTANKALLAAEGPDLYEAADEAGVDVYYEAAVGGAIPLLRPIRESLAGDQIRRVLGIVNGTTNYILDAMDRSGTPYTAALATAQELGYAEADPTADVGGGDAAAKAAILASLAFHTRVPLHAVHVEGITEVTPFDLETAASLGYAVKLLAVVERAVNGISARVYPALIPADHVLAGVSGAFNAVFVEAANAGELMFYGPGAGGAPTASAVMGDLVSIARNRVHHGKGPAESHYAALPLIPFEELVTSYYLSVQVIDRPGVLAAVAGAFSARGISLATVRQQPDESAPGSARLVVVTHDAREREVQAALDDLRSSDDVIETVLVLRVEGAPTPRSEQ